MISEFLQFGYLGLLALLIFLCYRIIIGSQRSTHSFAQTMVLVAFFAFISLSGGVAGYLWASKELEAAKANKSATAMLNSQIKEARESHQANMAPFRDALADQVEKFKSSVLEVNRQEHHQRIESLSATIKQQEEIYIVQLKALKSVFDETVE